ncbi:hypothetical protein L1987_79960 [Smallanthus sonchifolius]|uniref:Uncharacterized protein n=1 Tax=Smallanthus sonchifolius TaxID=185202 RepID=A0ACB8YLD9_9ASTR|nr:hypothetical protein L1987_79960 [Smallanthus sonchifolius]
MDWFSWLSKTQLEPPFIHEYSIAFSHNQLEEDDISYFNHEFLQSMGISIAKHRLEILKLARKSYGSHPMARLIATVKKTKRTLARYVHTWVHRNDSAMVVVKRSRSYSSRWKEALVKRSNRMVRNKQGSATLLITSGYRPAVRSGGAKVNSFSGSLVYDLRHDESKENGGKYRDNLYSDDEVDGGYGGRDDGGEYWSGEGVEEIKWDAMFQNLKPT